MYVHSQGGILCAFLPNIKINIRGCSNIKVMWDISNLKNWHVLYTHKFVCFLSKIEFVIDQEELLFPINMENLSPSRFSSFRTK